jgi:LysM repeat protein
VEAHTEEKKASSYALTTYEVQQGDSIYAIADKFGLQPSTILWCNYTTLQDNPAFISPGEELEIPPTDGVTYTWNEGDGLNGVANGLGVKPEDIIDWPGNNLNTDTIGDYAHPILPPAR